MEVIILAGGFGSRLQKVVSDVPKPLAPVNGRPFLEILIAQLVNSGVKRVILSLGYKAEKIMSHFGTNFEGVKIDYIIENKPLGTGGALKLASYECKNDHMIVINGDTFMDLNLKRIEKTYFESDCPIVVGRKVRNSSRYNKLLLDDLKILDFNYISNKPGVINAGCYVLPVKALDNYPVNYNFSLETDFFIPQVKRININVFIHDGIFIDIGIPEDYEFAQSLLSSL